MDALFRISPIFWGHLTILLGYSKLVFTISFSTNFSAKILYGLQFFFPSLRYIDFFFCVTCVDLRLDTEPGWDNEGQIRD